MGFNDRPLSQKVKGMAPSGVPSPFQGERFCVAECVDLPVVTKGKTLGKAVENVREAIALHIERESLEDWDISPDFSILADFDLEPVYAKA